MRLTNYCVVLLNVVHITCSWHWVDRRTPNPELWKQSASALSVFFFASLLVAALQNTANFKEQNRTVSSALCLQPDVLFRDEFGSLHSTTVIYIGSAWTNEGFFSLLNAKTKTEGGGSYLQFGASIKMLIVGNHFSAVTMAAPKDSETDGPTRIHYPEFLIFKHS